MVSLGHAFRIGSMFYAGSNFNHLVQTKKAEGHKLITSGPYRFSRHPSYFGWTIWAVGTQLMLSNFVCAILWYLAALMFFQNRIPHEEHYLIKFFGPEYLEYAQKTPIGIPFVKGHSMIDK